MSAIAGAEDEAVDADGTGEAARGAAGGAGAANVGAIAERNGFVEAACGAARNAEAVAVEAACGAARSTDGWAVEAVAEDVAVEAARGAARGAAGGPEVAGDVDVSARNGLVEAVVVVAGGAVGAACGAARGAAGGPEVAEKSSDVGGAKEAGAPNAVECRGVPGSLLLRRASPATEPLSSSSSDPATLSL